MENLLGLKCGLCGREFDVSPDLSTVQCPSCGRLMSTAARGLRVPESVADYEDPRDVTHEWDYDYVGEFHTVRGIRYLELRYEKTIGKYIVAFRGGNPNEGRHSDTSSPPEEQFSDYDDALREYMKFAEKYAPDNVKSKVRKYVKSKLKG